MSSNIEDFNAAHNKSLKKLSKEERAKAGLKKLAQELEASKDSISEPKGMTSGASGKDGKMIIDLDEDNEDEQ